MTPCLNLQIFLSSPGDVTDERNLARGVIRDELHVDPFIRGRVTIQDVSWDDPAAPTPMLANLTPQEAITRGLPRPSECDVVVVILWAKMGTPLPAEYKKPNGDAYLSGTEWEFEDALNANPQPDILVYRRTEEPTVKLGDSALQTARDQYFMVQRFFDRFRDTDGSLRGGVVEYATPAAFVERLKSDLRELVRRRLERENLPDLTVANDSETSFEGLWDRSPYPGLRSFNSDEASIFFGRDGETDALLKRLRDADGKFLAVVGASGTGKSSLIRAGLLPRLSNNALEGSRDWCELSMTPGAFGPDPFLALAAELHRWLPPSSDCPQISLAQELAEVPPRIGDRTAQILAGRPAWARVLLFIDQFEELFTLTAERLQPKFVDLLVHAVLDAGVVVLITLRTDFFARAIGVPHMARLLESGMFPLSSPGPAALVDMIRRPAQRAGLEVPSELVDAIVEDAGDDPGALPLIAFCLEDLYRRTTPEHRLTLAVYEELGRLKAAIERRVTDIVVKLPAAQRRALPRLFNALVHSTINGTVTRRRAPKAELETSSDVERAAAALIQERLLQASGEAQFTGVEIAHEILFEVWPEFRSWLSNNSEQLTVRADVVADMRRWERDRDEEFLIPPGKRLKRAIKLLEKRPEMMLDGMVDFVERSRQRADSSISVVGKTLFWRRCAALWIDGLAFLFVLIIAATTISGLGLFNIESATSGNEDALGTLLGLTVFPFYLFYDFICILKWSRTFGKFVMGLAVETWTGERIRIKKAMLRALVYGLELLLYPIFLLVLVGPTYMTLHERISKTKTVIKRPRRN